MTKTDQLLTMSKATTTTTTKAPSLEALAELSFGGAAELWDPALDWETRLPPIASDDEAARLAAAFREEEPEHRALHVRLLEGHAELAELEELQGRVDAASPEHYRIQAALNERYYANQPFLAALESFYALHGKLDTIRGRVVDWEARRDAEVLSGSLSSLDLDEDSSPCASPLGGPSLPPLPALPVAAPGPAALRARATKAPRLNPDATDFVPAARTGHCPLTPPSAGPLPVPASCPQRPGPQPLIVLPKVRFSPPAPSRLGPKLSVFLELERWEAGAAP